ncbi:MAG: hypothetical protein HFF19_01120 [Oscillospiraceae bacterium]|jgi:microcystin-dependent protein|nr:hypothetical protein [Oscillospiraceae bacterium]
MRHTDFLNLNLPEDTDPVEIGDLSENFETIDTSLSAGGGIPAGGIIIWSGAADAVPPGWALCDGTNNTPDLRDRFVLGGGGSRAVGSTGGAETHKLTTSEMPSHKHSVGVQGSNTGATEGIYGARTNTTNTINSGSAGGNAAHSIMPPYYVLCYIMKIA